MSYTDSLISSALKTAASSHHHKWLLGAVLVKGSTILVASPNKVRAAPHPGFWRDSTFHAEEAALRRIRSSHRQPDTIVVARVNRAGLQRLARPCERCWKQIVASGVTNILYTLDDEGYGYEKVVLLTKTTFLFTAVN